MNILILVLILILWAVVFRFLHSLDRPVYLLELSDIKCRLKVYYHPLNRYLTKDELEDQYVTVKLPGPLGTDRVDYINFRFNFLTFGIQTAIYEHWSDALDEVTWIDSDDFRVEIENDVS